MMNHRISRTSPSLVLLTVVTLLAAGSSAWADVNQRPIAIPLIGTEGVASPYPSTITIAAPGGAGQTGPVSVVLHAVTHPCPRDIVVALVHNDEKFLLMNNAGGCRPLQGTTIEFVNDLTRPSLFDGPQDTPFPPFVQVRPSFEGAQPALPAPFPQGGVLVSGMPSGSLAIDGNWDLYVFDRRAENRGVVAGGWSLQYDTPVSLLGPLQFVPIPLANGATLSPIPFDASAVPEDLQVREISVSFELAHPNPADVVIVLRSPSGTAVPLMANCGGAFDLTGVALTFADDGSAVVPFNAPIPAGRYRPSDRAGITTIPGGPASTFANTMSVFTNQPVKGLWTLWVYDLRANSVGSVALPRLTIRAAAAPKATISTPAATSTASQPFVHVEGLLDGLERTRGTVTWHVTSGTTFYEAGAFALDPATGRISADVPVRKGANTIRYRAWNNGFSPVFGELQVTVGEFTYSLAEGATGSFFDLDLTLGNPAGVNAPVRVDLLPEGGAASTHADTVTANQPLQLRVNALLPDAAVSTVVHSLDAVPLTVERTMTWDARGYGGHGGGAASPATRWLFAEGAQGFFNTFVLLANDQATAVDVTVRFLLEGGGVVTHGVSVPARSRRTIFAGDLPDVVGRSFGLDVTASAPIIAERAMYFSMGTDRLFDGGHESAGVTEPGTRWFLAEGATGPFFDCFVLLGNPNASEAKVTLTYLLPDGTTIPQALAIPANSRHTINVETVDPRLANAAVSTIVAADLGIVVERAMYWPNIAEGWREAHNSFGVTQAGLRWAVADGRLGGPRGYDTYILLANPNPVPAEVQVRFLDPGGAVVTRTYTLPPTSRLNVQASAEAPELGDGLFSAEIQVLNFQPIAVEKAMYWNAEGVIWAAGTNVTATRLPPR